MMSRKISFDIIKTQSFDATGKKLTATKVDEGTRTVISFNDTKEAVENKVKEVGNVKGIINFHCILRTLELESKGITEPYGEIFTKIPTIGFSTYGEEYIGHINQTSTMLVFK